MVTTQRVLSMLCLPLAWACQPTAERDAPPAQVRKGDYFGTPITLDLADSACTPRRAVSDIGKRKIWLNIDGKTTLSEVDLTGFSGDQLKSQAIIATIYGREEHEESRSSRNDPYDAAETYFTRITSTGKSLAICRTPDDEPYPKNSLENMALAMAWGIARAYGLQESAASRKRVPPITLLVQPLITRDTIVYDPATHTETISTHMRTDNAYWTITPQNRSAQNPDGYTIVALPHSEEYFATVFGSVAIWERAAWFSHEYAHHLFFTHAPRVVVGQAHAGASVKPSLANDGLNEGFADLIAYYSFMSWERNHGRLAWGRDIHNRDVTTCECDHGTSAKALDETFITHYFEGVLHHAQHGEPSANDSHALGAIVAHGFFAILNAAYEEIFLDPRTEAILQGALVFNWLDRLQTLVTPEQGSAKNRAYLMKSIRVFVELVEQQVGELTAPQCQILGKVFPAFLSDREGAASARHCAAMAFLPY